MSLGDLDELAQACRDGEARKFIAEAVTCYRAGAYKACIVSTWIAVVYDLLSKFRELALNGDAQAQQLTTELTNLQPKIALNDQGAIKRVLEIERTSLDIANNQFGFFDGQQLVDLKRLKEDRNRCAHPTYQGTDQPYAPSAELARSHLVHAVSHVLSVPPVQGNQALADDQQSQHNTHTIGCSGRRRAVETRECDHGEPSLAVGPRRHLGEPVDVFRKSRDAQAERAQTDRDGHG